jgi:hypothetical protein
MKNMNTLSDAVNKVEVELADAKQMITLLEQQYERTLVKLEAVRDDFKVQENMLADVYVGVYGIGGSANATHDDLINDIFEMKATSDEVSEETAEHIEGLLFQVDGAVKENHAFAWHLECLGYSDEAIDQIAMGIPSVHNQALDLSKERKIMNRKLMQIMNIVNDTNDTEED